jgi:hypothetical protein
MVTTKPSENPQVSYLTLRRMVGALGVVLPIVLGLMGFFILQGMELLDSIRHYYGLRTRDVFVGTLFVIGWFLFTYRGYEWKDDLAGNLACLFALLVALLPNSGETWERTIHFSSAVLLFLTLAYFSICLFTKSDGSPTPQKKVRNKVYYVCGWTILACLALIGVYYVFLKGSPISQLKPVFWLESLMLWAFGVSWFIKGETLLKDKAAVST